jgi:DNA adenine methylase
MIKELIARLPEHRVYVEVFGGAANLLLNKPPSPLEVYNDYNGELVNLFRVVRDRPVEFERRLEYLIYSRGWYNLFRDEIRSGALVDSLERALAFYYLLEGGFAGKWYAGWAYGLTCDRNNSWHPRAGEILDISERLKHVYIDRLDFTTCIEHWDSPDTLFFCDPPYLTAHHHDKIPTHYYGGFKDARHKELSEVLHSIKGKFLLTYDEAPLIRELYADCKIGVKQLPNSVIRRTHGKTRPDFANLIITKG